MAYVDTVGLCFTNAKGKVLKPVHSMHHLEYLIHQINDYFEKFFQDTILPDIGVGIYTRFKVEPETSDDDTDGEVGAVLY
jgi:hypothetical protein